jgi:Putative adhesin
MTSRELDADLEDVMTVTPPIESGGVAGPAGPGRPARTPGRRPGRPARFAALTVGALLTLGLIGFACFDLVALVSRDTRTFDNTFPAAAVRAVDVATSDVDVRIVGGAPAGRPVTAHSSVRFSWDDPVYGATLDRSGTLRVRLRCAHWTPIGCDGHIVITVPSGVSVSAHSDDGGVRAEAIDGPVTLSSSDGGVSVSNVSGDLALSTSDGGIRGDGVRSARVTAETSDGGVTLTFAAPPTSVTATSSDGGVRVHLPDRSGPYYVQAHASDGGTRTSVRSDPRSSRTITLSSGDGGVSVDYATG